MQLLNSRDNLVVITEGGLAARFIGLCRTARNELSRDRLFVFVVDQESRNDASLATKLVETLRRACSAIDRGEAADYEHYWCGGDRFCSERMSVLDIAEPQTPESDETVELGVVESRLQVGTPGLLSTLNFHRILLDREPLEPDQVKLRSMLAVGAVGAGAHAARAACAANLPFDTLAADVALDALRTTGSGEGRSGLTPLQGRDAGHGNAEGFLEFPRERARRDRAGGWRVRPGNA